jgi:hypothetical protein
MGPRPPGHRHRGKHAGDRCRRYPRRSLGSTGSCCSRSRRHGREFRRIGRFVPTSRTCSQCGAKNGPKPLHVRAWQREACGAWLDRDINAAINVARAAGLGGDSLWSAGKTRGLASGAARRSRNPPRCRMTRHGRNLPLQAGEDVNSGSTVQRPPEAHRQPSQTGMIKVAALSPASAHPKRLTSLSTIRTGPGAGRCCATVNR